MKKMWLIGVFLAACGDSSPSVAADAGPADARQADAAPADVGQADASSSALLACQHVDEAFAAYALRCPATTHPPTPTDCTWVLGFVPGASMNVDGCVRWAENVSCTAPPWDVSCTDLFYVTP